LKSTLKGTYKWKMRDYSPILKEFRMSLKIKLKLSHSINNKYKVRPKIVRYLSKGPN